VEDLLDDKPKLIEREKKLTEEVAHKDAMVGFMYNCIPWVSITKCQ
jgi:hypothetical protein